MIRSCNQIRLLQRDQKVEIIPLLEYNLTQSIEQEPFEHLAGAEC